MSNQTNEVAAPAVVVQETVVPKRFWSDEQIADLMIPVGFAEYCSVAYEEAVAIGLRMRDEADARIADLEAELDAACADAVRWREGHVRIINGWTGEVVQP